MRTVKLGNADVGVVGQGTWQLDRYADKDVVRAIQRGLDLDMNHLDLSEMWGGGEVERMVGLAVKDRRDKALLAWKVRPHLAGADLAATLDTSLQRLGTDHVDLLVLHFPDESPLDAFVAAADAAVAAGKARAWGVGRFDNRRLKALLDTAPGRVACNQVEYHVRMRRPERELLPFCAERGIPVVAYSPMGSGNFPDGPGPGAALLKKLARARKATPRQVALAYLLRHPHVLVVPRAVTLAHVVENAAAADLQLPAEDVAALDATFNP